MSSLVLKRYDGDWVKFDITSEQAIHYNFWINKYSLKEVDQLSNEAYKIYELLRQPMFVVFVDYRDQKYADKCFKAAKELQKVAPKYSNYFGFFEVDNNLFMHRKRVLGITWDELPAMAFNMID